MLEALSRFIRRGVLALAAALAPVPSISFGAVVINEIHFNPPEGSVLEFVELYNSGPVEVSLSGFSFSAGIRFTFPEGTSIAAGGYLAVARDPSLLARHFRLGARTGLILGPHDSSLDNGGESLELSDATGAVIDQVRYEDSPPWPLAADGQGGSLERVCPQGDAQLPWSWSADPQRGPTPLAATSGMACPPPAHQPPPLVISEIYYHPTADADSTQEFVEIHNPTARAVDLTGHSLGQGVHYRFTDGTSLDPGGHLVVARSLAGLRDTLGVAGDLVGEFTGQLDNGGERVTLFDARGAMVDTVRYADQGDWPVAADGLGRSLERISPSLPGDDPAAWSVATLADGDRWRSVAVTGPGVSSSLYIYLLAAGEFLLDDLVLEDLQSPGVNLLQNGSFDAGLDRWTPAGNHLDSAWQADGEPGAGGALRVIASGRGNGPTNGIATTLDPPLVRTTSYRLSLRYRYLSGDPSLTLRLNGATAGRGIFIDVRTRPLVTPGEPSTVGRARVPPFISHVRRFPLEPRSTDEVTLTARVRGVEVRGVYLDYWLNFRPQLVDALEMLDDGLHGDGGPGDGVYGARLPPFPRNNAVTFRIHAEDSTGGSRELPAPGDPTGVLGFYVNDDQPASPLPRYHLLVDHTVATNPMAIIRGLNCDVYRSAAFAVNGELFPAMSIRQRGQSVCNSQKPFLKLRFNRGREFQGRRKINLQSLWTDKSLVREHLAWRFFGEMDNPDCTHRYVRLNANGQYFGLYAELEHPDADFLARNGLDPQGNLYKAVASREERMPDYRAGYEKKTNENGDFSDLKTFLDTMNTIPRTQLRPFWEENVFPDSLIDYQAAQVLTNNRDYPHKNHYLYHDTADGRWRTITWDMDLTLGKFWDGNNGGVLNDLMDNPGITPWYTTRVAGEGIGNYLLDRFFFDTPDRWYQRALRVRIWIALKEKYLPELFDRKVFAARDLLMGEQDEDLRKWGRSAATANDRTAPRDFLPNLERVRTHIKTRQTYLNNYLRVTDRLPPPDRLKLTELMYHPTGKAEELEFIELYNNSERDIDISGWSIEAVGYAFPAESRVAAGEVFVVARSPEAFAATYGENVRVFGPYPDDLANDGEELRVRDAGPGYPASIDVLRYRSERPWPTQPDGLGHSLELTGVHVDRDNDPAENWRASAFPGGTPGTVPGLIRGVPFLRGNCNGDQKVNITDAITLLGVLFYGFQRPRCVDGCDASGDRALGLVDVVVILRYLFFHEDAIPPPGPRACGTVEGSFCEETSCPAG